MLQINFQLFSVAKHPMSILHRCVFASSTHHQNHKFEQEQLYVDVAEM